MKFRKTLRRFKRKIRASAILLLVAVLLVTAGCQPVPKPEKSDRLRIVTTIFPPYDFAREIVGDNAEITMMLRPGMESHTYEPSPADMIAVENCDLFIYNGGESDAWVDTILDTVDTSDCRVLRMMEYADVLEEESVEGIQNAHTHEHIHEHEESHHHQDEEHEEVHEMAKDEANHEEGHTAEYDEHIWTSPKNAVKITEAIANAVIELDPSHQAVYQENLNQYVKALKALDREFEEIVAHAKHKMILFGDRFPFLYFAKSYGLDYRAAFPGCSSESEPSAKTVAYLIDKIRKERIPYIFYIEFSNQKLAKTIQEETGAVPLLFHSCHNLSKDEMEQRCTYLGLMQKNAENLKEALESDTDSMR